MVTFSRNKPDDQEKTPTASDVDKLQIKGHEPGLGGQFKDFLKTVVNFAGADLSALTCPTFFLNGLSLLEYG
jgi:hypothetical protein